MLAVISFVANWVVGRFLLHPSVAIRLGFGFVALGLLASPLKRCLRSLFRFILPAVEQVRSDPVTPTRLRDVPAVGSLLYNQPLLFRGSIYA
jgi:hypothetical protein